MNERYRRQDHEPPLAVKEWGWRFHHVGIPTGKPVAGEQYLPGYKLYHGGFETSPYGIEWMRFEEDCPLHEMIRTLPHVAFEVNDLDEELRRHEFHVITPPNSPSPGVKVVMIEHNGAPVELITFYNRNL